MFCPTMLKLRELYRTAALLALITIYYNIAEGVISVWFGAADETLSLFGFGLDSFVEVISGIGIWHMVRRLGHGETADRDPFERRALQITGGGFYLLAGGLVATALVSFFEHHRPVTTKWGIVVSLISIVAMQALIHYKVKVGTALNSPAILADAANLSFLRHALDQLQAESIAVPPFSLKYLRKGHAIHFRCQHPEVQRMRIDVMSRMRGVDPFPALWKRRVTIELPDGTVCDLISLPDLVQAKKTQRDKDWPMIRRLVEAHYFQNSQDPTPARITFWLMQLRTPELLISLAASYPSRCDRLMQARPAILAALSGKQQDLEQALMDEEQVEHVDAEPLHRGVVRPQGRVATVVVVPHLRRHEHVLARDVTRGQRAPHPRLVAVEPGGVDVAVADLERATPGRVDLGVGHLPDSEAELRDREPRRRGVSERQGGKGVRRHDFTVPTSR